MFRRDNEPPEVQECGFLADEEGFVATYDRQIEELDQAGLTYNTPSLNGLNTKVVLIIGLLSTANTKSCMSPVP